MKLGDALNSINNTKKNLVRNDDGSINYQQSKAFPSFPTLRTLSYSIDCLPYLAFLNQRMLKDHKMIPAMQFEFLLNVIPKQKRYVKWHKPENDDIIQLIIKHHNVSFQTAKSYLRLLTSEQINLLLTAEGGKDIKGKST